MNKKFIITIAVSVALIVGSCKKFLTINPQFEFTSTIATSSLDGLSKTTIGEFNQLQSTNLYGGGIIANSELLADFVYADPISDFSLNQLRTRQMNSINAQAGGLWGDAYRAIYIANVVLQYAPSFYSQNPSQVQLIRGESFFVRGIMHFELLRMFAQPSGFTNNDSHLGIPIVLTPGTISSGQNTPRSTVAQCYAQIESDLDSAYALLPASPQTIASQAAAAAFLTRVYFTQHQYSNALTWANIVINTPGLALNPTDSAIYSASGSASGTGFTPETVFQQITYAGSTGLAGTSSQTQQDINNGTLIGDFYATSTIHPTFRCNTNTGSLFDQSYVADSAAGGHRWNELFGYATIGLPPELIRHLYTKKYGNGSLYMNVTVIRLAEMILTRAECNERLGASDATVRADLNLIRVRAGLLPDNTSTSPALLNEIWAERDYELAFEGDRFYEIKRRQITFNSPESGQQFSWNSSQLLYPIPIQEVQENKNMIQNPGY